MPKVELDIDELTLLIDALDYYIESKNRADEAEELYNKLNAEVADCFDLDKVQSAIAETKALIQAEETRNAS